MTLKFKPEDFLSTDDPPTPGQKKFFYWFYGVLAGGMAFSLFMMWMDK